METKDREIGQEARVQLCKADNRSAETEVAI